jgi:hypothetical protein
MARGLDARKYFWRSGREKCFSLDIPFNRTSGSEQLPYCPLLGLNRSGHRSRCTPPADSTRWPIYGQGETLLRTNFPVR